MTTTKTENQKRKGPPKIKEPKKHPRRPPIYDPPAQPKKNVPVEDPEKHR
jgi:hypothetical protein